MQYNTDDPMNTVYQIVNNERSAYLYIMRTADGLNKQGGKHRLKFGFTSDIQQRAMQLGMIPLLVSAPFRRGDIRKVEGDLKQFIETGISDLDGEYFSATAEEVESIRCEKHFKFPVDVKVYEYNQPLSQSNNPYTLNTRRVKPLSEMKKARNETLGKIFNGRGFTRGVKNDGSVCNHIDTSVVDSGVNPEPGHGYQVFYMALVCKECGHRFRRLHVSEYIGTYYVNDLPPSFDD